MHFDNFDVVVVVECLGDALDQRGDKIDAETHIAGFHDRRALGRLSDQGVFFGGMACRADDMNEAGIRREFGKDQRRRRNRELDQDIGRSQQRRGIAGDDDAIAAKPR
jgi:hypothetical protein